MASFPTKDGRWGVIVLAHGAPDRLEDVPAFLLSLRNGRPLAKAAVEEIVERYRRISTRSGGPPGEASPLTRLTGRQGDALQARLGRPVYVGMRNWKPYIADAVRQASGDGLEHVTAVCLAPQNSRRRLLRTAGAGDRGASSPGTRPRCAPLVAGFPKPGHDCGALDRADGGV